MFMLKDIMETQSCQSREELVEDVLQNLLNKDFTLLKLKWRAFEDATSTYDKAMTFAYQHTLSEMGAATVLDLIMKNIDQTMPDSEIDSVLLWACLIFCHNMTRIMPVLRRMWAMKKTVFPLLIKMLKHENHVVRHSGVIMLCQMVMGATHEQLSDVLKRGIIEWDFLINSLRKTDVQYVSVLTFKHVFNQILKIYLTLVQRLGRPAQEFLWTTRLMEFSEDAYSRKYTRYYSESPKAQVEKDFMELIREIGDSLARKFEAPRNPFSDYPPELLILQHPKEQDYPVMCSFPSCAKSEVITKENKTTSFIPCDMCGMAEYCSKTCKAKHWSASHERWCDQWVTGQATECSSEDGHQAGEKCPNSTFELNEK